MGFAVLSLLIAFGIGVVSWLAVAMPFGTVYDFLVWIERRVSRPAWVFPVFAALILGGITLSGVRKARRQHSAEPD